MTTKADLYQSVRLSDLSVLVYSKANTVRRKLNRKGYRINRGYSKFKFFHGPKGSTQAFGVANKKEIILCYRGTEPTALADWLVNIKFSQTEIVVNNQTHQVFKGFWRALSHVWPRINAWLQAMFERFPQAKLHLTGHSLGGALSCLTMVKLYQQDQLDKVTSVYTFGCPRCVHQDFAEALNDVCKERVFRFVNDEDLVADLPPDNELVDFDPMNYSHFGKLVLFDEDGEAHYQDPLGRWKEVRKRIRNKPWWRKIIDNIADVIDVTEPVRDHFKHHYRDLCKARFRKYKNS